MLVKYLFLAGEKKTASTSMSVCVLTCERTREERGREAEKGKSK